MQSIEEILQRNNRVELDKARETSYTRRGMIAGITYITVVVFLVIIGDSLPFIHALVPAGGCLLSALGLPVVKSWWLKRYSR